MSEYRCYIYFKICISLSGPIPSSVRVCVAPPGKVSFPRQSQAYRCLHGHIWASLLFSVASLIVTTIFWYFTEKIFIIFLALFLNDNLQKCSTRLYHKSPSLVTWERQNGFVWNSKTGGGGTGRILLKSGYQLQFWLKSDKHQPAFLAKPHTRSCADLQRTSVMFV